MMSWKIPNIRLCCCGALLIRLALTVYGEWQDRVMTVKYTDIDYHVFTDAARYVLQGASPYTRATYRYTPLMAWLLTPNLLLTPLFGKFLFIICDVITGLLIFRILKLIGYPERSSLCSAILWLFNPLPMIVSSRGNAEPIMSLLVLMTLYAIMHQRTVAAAVFYAISVHVKIYPITYCIPIYFLLGEDYIKREPSPRNKHVVLRSHLTGLLGELLRPNQERTRFVCVSVGVFCMLTLLMYYCYGDAFLHETYLYHITRQDTRHNFSPYFYMLYLTAETPVSLAAGLLAFLPQVVLLLSVSVRFYKDVVFCCFCQTFLFVAFNKVCTSQYFLWYLCLLPIIIPTVRMPASEGLLLVFLWFSGQAVWLRYAYFLEFEGRDDFIPLWLAGLLFFAINIGILARLITSYKQHRTFINGRLGSLGAGRQYCVESIHSVREQDRHVN